MEKFKNIVFWFLKHPVLSGVGSVVTIVSVLIPFFNHYNSELSSSGQPESKNPSCIEKSIQVLSQNEKINLPKSSRYLSNCYVDGCYTHQLKITNLVETDISNQYLKGLDWHVGVSVFDTKAGIPIHSKVIKIRSNGQTLDEARNKSPFQLDEKIHVWLDTLNVCNKEKRK